MAALMAATAASLYVRAYYQPDWRQTAAKILHAEVKNTHYNAQDYRAKVTVSYEYVAGLTTQKGHYVGFWPEVGGPNALPPGDINKLFEPGHVLVAFYDPRDPSRSELHPQLRGPTLVHFLATVAGFVLAGAYTLFVYPKWRV